MSFTTADICDVHGKAVEIVAETLHSYGGVDSFSGEIVTILLDKDNSDLVAMLRDEQGNGRVVVVDVYARYCAIVGDTLMGYALKNGWAGIVINGYVRDTKITKNIEVGLMALGTCPRKSSKIAPSQRDIDLHFGGVSFKVGGYLYADEDGIVVSSKKL